MNFLALVNRARRECGVTGAALPNLSDNLTTESLRFKDWVGESWRDLYQAKGEWEWLRRDVVLSTVVGHNTYPASATDQPRLRAWKRDSFRAYRASVGAADEQILPFMEYQAFRNVYLFGNMRTVQSRPAAFTVTPDRSLMLGPLPDDVYTVNGEGWIQPQDLENDEDDPEDSGLPERFHMLLVYGAMRSFASFEAAPEVFQRADAEYKRLMAKLYVFGLPSIQDGPPLA